MSDKDKRLADYDQRIEQAAKTNERAQRLMAVPGVGKLIATAVVAAVNDARHFHTGRDMATNLGLYLIT